MNFMSVFNKLYGAFGPQHWWPAETPFEMMVGAILTQNTAWSNVEKALNNFNGRLSPQFILETPENTLSEIIRPSGFWGQKVLYLKALASWFNQYGCSVKIIRERDSLKIRRELLSLHGVGFETADSIMLYAFGQPYFVIDAYTKRIFARLGCSLPKNYEDIRTIFESKLPHDAALYNEYHALIVYLAKSNCKKVPTCDNCPLRFVCKNANSRQLLEK